jgi:hypothetical protein
VQIELNGVTPPSRMSFSDISDSAVLLSNIR